VDRASKVSGVWEPGELAALKTARKLLHGLSSFGAGLEVVF